MNMDEMSREEQNDALLNDLAAVDTASEGTYSEQEGELEENTQEEESEETDGGQESDEEPLPEENLPKTKSVGKLLAKNNALKARIAELESQTGTSREIDLEYINTLVEQKATKMMYENDFYKQNPSAGEIQDNLEEYAKGMNLEHDLDRAYKFYLLENDPDELRVQANKQNAKKLSSPSYSASKLKATPKANELSSTELAGRLSEMVGKGEFRLY